MGTANCFFSFSFKCLLNFGATALISKPNTAVYITVMEFKYESSSPLNEGAFEEEKNLARFCPHLVSFNFGVNFYLFSIKTVKTGAN